MILQFFKEQGYFFWDTVFFWDFIISVTLVVLLLLLDKYGSCLYTKLTGLGLDENEYIIVLPELSMFLNSDKFSCDWKHDSDAFKSFVFELVLRTSVNLLIQSSKKILDNEVFDSEFLNSKILLTFLVSSLIKIFFFSYFAIFKVCFGRFFQNFDLIGLGNWIGGWGVFNETLILFFSLMVFKICWDSSKLAVTISW